MLDFKDYYKVLEIERGASEKEIQQAMRRLAKDLHPDTHPDDKDKANRLKEVTEAYQVLSDPDKRKRYDTWGSSGIENTVIRGKGPVTWDSVFPKEWFTQPAEATTPTLDESISLPVNDLGLLKALTLAMKEKGDGTWNIPRSGLDTRVGTEKNSVSLGEIVYQVRKKGLGITIFRTVDDWRGRGEREGQIFVKRNGKAAEALDGKGFIPTELLALQGQLVDVNGEDIRTPYGFLKYLQDLRGLAQKMVFKGKDYQNEIRGINQFLKNYSRRRSDLRDPTITIPLEDLRGRIEAEMVFKSLEGASGEGPKINFGEGRI